MDRVAFKAEFARKADEAQLIMAQMRIAATMSARSVDESRKRIEETRTLLKKSDGG